MLLQHYQTLFRYTVNRCQLSVSFEQSGFYETNVEIAPSVIALILNEYSGL